jgi:DNA-binding SARP family transcriptional activator/Tfp pilus assembly protein PilF
VEFKLLGPLEVTDRGRRLALGSGRQRALLAALLLRADRVVSVDELTDLVWDGAAPRQARAAVQTNLMRLRRSLGRTVDGSLVVTEGAGYAIRMEDPDYLDLQAFDTLLDLARQRREAQDPLAQSQLLARALALWRGEPLADVPSEVLRREAGARLAERRLWALEQRIEADLRLGRHAELIAELRGLTAEYPLREQFWAQLMVALYSAGRQAEALAAYQRARGVLVESLGVEPGPVLREAEHAVLTGTVPAHTAPSEVPRQLPADVAAFAGRTTELAQLDDLLAGAGGGDKDGGGSDGDGGAGGGSDGGTAAMVVSVIDGMAGVGKTALAIHWAHRVADRFPDGQLYVDLRGFHRQAQAMSAAEALRGFLDALAVPAHRRPDGVQAQAAFYRSLLAGRRVLVVLDNARDAEQVRPLLPGSPGCLALVTSRNQLLGLVTVEGARPLTVALPGEAEARELLARRLGAARLAAEPQAVGEIVDRCARLPLALAVVAARAATRPAFPLGVLAADLRDARDGLAALAGDDTAADVRAVFSWSYRLLGEPAARLFRLLGVHPGPDVTVPAAASLAGAPDAEAHASLAELTRSHLLAEPSPGRYALHDLLRAYAAGLAEARDGRAERRAARRRVLDHYLHTAYAAARLIDPCHPPITLAPPAPGTRPEHLARRDQALAWFTVERPVLVAAVRQAAGHGEPHTWQLACSLTSFLDRQRHWPDLAEVHQAALGTARSLGDGLGQAYAHRDLAMARVHAGEFDDARGHLRRALELFQLLGTPVEQACTYAALTWLSDQEDDPRASLEHARHALDLFRQLGDHSGEARTLNNIGWSHARLGDYRAAVDHCRRALALQEQAGDEECLGYTLDSLGYAHHRLGDRDLAIRCYERAMAAFRAQGNHGFEAHALVELGDVRHAAGESSAAADAWRQALDILGDLDYPLAQRIRERLSSTARPSAGRSAPASPRPRS